MRYRISLAVLAVLLGVGCAQAATDSTAKIAYLAYTAGYWQVFVMNADGSEPIQVTQSMGDKTRLSWFPDGESLLANASGGRVFRVSLKGEESAIVLDPPGTLDAVVSPDGLKVAFSLSTSGSVDDNNIWTNDIHGKHPEKVFRMPHLQHEPSWSPDGKTIYFLSGDGNQSHDIWRLETDTKHAEQLTVDKLYHFDVVARGDGTLAFSSNRGGDYDLWLMSPNGETTQLTEDQALDGRPSWSPDDESIAFESSRGGAMNIWRIDIATKTLTQLSHEKIGARFPVWHGSAP